MKAKIINNVVVQYPDFLSDSVVDTLVNHEILDYRTKSLALGGIDIMVSTERPGQLEVRSWVRSPYKYVKFVPDLIPQTVDQTETPTAPAENALHEVTVKPSFFCQMDFVVKNLFGRRGAR